MVPKISEGWKDYLFKFSNKYWIILIFWQFGLQLYKKNWKTLKIILKEWKQKENKLKIGLIIQKRYGKMMLRLMFFDSFDHIFKFAMLLLCPCCKSVC